MTTLVWLIIIAAILIAITRLGLAIRHHEAHAPQENPVARGDRDPFDLMS